MIVPLGVLGNSESRSAWGKRRSKRQLNDVETRCLACILRGIVSFTPASRQSAGSTDGRFGAITGLQAQTAGVNELCPVPVRATGSEAADLPGAERQVPERKAVPWKRLHCLARSRRG